MTQWSCNSQTGRGDKKVAGYFWFVTSVKVRKKKKNSFCSLSEDSEPVCTSFTVSLFLESLGFSTSVGIKRRSCSSWTRTQAFKVCEIQRKLLPDNERSGQSLTSFAGRNLLSPSLWYFIIVILYVTYITAGPALADVTQGFLRWSAAYLVCRRMTLTDHPFYCVFDFFYEKLLISIYNTLKPINIVDEVGPK